MGIFDILFTSEPEEPVSFPIFDINGEETSSTLLPLYTTTFVSTTVQSAAISHDVYIVLVVVGLVSLLVIICCVFKRKNVCRCCRRRNLVGDEESVGAAGAAAVGGPGDSGSDIVVSMTQISRNVINRDKAECKFIADFHTKAHGYFLV